jgi:large subunit ribosomal protein L29
MKAADLRDRSTEDLVELERSLTNERFQSKFKNFTNRLDDTSLIRKHKRDLARVKLILAERSRGITAVGKPRDEGRTKPKTRAPIALPERPSTEETSEAVETTDQPVEKSKEAPRKSTKSPAKGKPAKAEAKGGAEKAEKKAKPAAKTTAKKPKGETK